MYHGVSAWPLPVFNWCQLPLAEFEQQLEYLHANYVVLPLREVIEPMDRSAPLPRTRPF